MGPGELLLNWILQGSGNVNGASMCRAALAQTSGRADAWLAELGLGAVVYRRPDAALGEPRQARLGRAGRMAASLEAQYRGLRLAGLIAVALQAGAAGAGTAGWSLGGMWFPGSRLGPCGGLCLRGGPFGAPCRTGPMWPRSFTVPVSAPGGRVG